MTAALLVAVSIQFGSNKYLYDQDLGVRVCLFVYMSLDVCKLAHDTRVIPSVRHGS